MASTLSPNLFSEIPTHLMFGAESRQPQQPQLTASVIGKLLLGVPARQLVASISTEVGRPTGIPVSHDTKTVWMSGVSGGQTC